MPCPGFTKQRSCWLNHSCPVLVLWSQKPFLSQVDWSSHILSWCEPCPSYSTALSQPMGTVSVMPLTPLKPVRSAWGWMVCCARCKWGEKLRLLTRDFGKLAAPGMAFLAVPTDCGESLGVAGGWLSNPVIPARCFSMLSCGTLVRRRHPAADETPLQLVFLLLQGKEQ